MSHCDRIEFAYLMSFLFVMAQVLGDDFLFVVHYEQWKCFPMTQIQNILVCFVNIN